MPPYTREAALSSVRVLYTSYIVDVHAAAYIILSGDHNIMAFILCGSCVLNKHGLTLHCMNYFEILAKINCCHAIGNAVRQKG